MGSHSSGRRRAGTNGGGTRRDRAENVRAVLDALRKIVRSLRLTARGAERTAGISGAQLFVLQSLAEARAPSLNDLAERTFTDQSSVSVLVRRLVEQKLIERRPSPDDARRVELQLTGAGRRLLARCPEPTQARLLAGLQRLLPADLAGLRSGLDALISQMDIADEPTRMLFDELETAGRGRGRKRKGADAG